MGILFGSSTSKTNATPIVPNQNGQPEVSTSQSLQQTVDLPVSWSPRPWKIARLFNPKVGQFFGGLSQYSTQQTASGVYLPTQGYSRAPSLNLYASASPAASNVRIPAVFVPAQR